MKNITLNGTNPTQAPSNDNNGSSKNLPVALEIQNAKPSLNMNTIPAHFVSQLIAERKRLAIQRPKRRAPVSLATRAYDFARNISIKRMPAGFTHESNV